MTSRRKLVLLAATLVGCDKAAKEPAAESAAIAPPTADIEVMSPDNSFKLMLPARWRGAFRTDTLTTAERGTALPGALNVVYLPQDTTIIPQTLAVVAVYDSAAWQKLKEGGGPLPGDSLLAKNSRVYVLALPQSNPFSPGTADALKFDSLSLKPADKATLVHVP